MNPITTELLGTPTEPLLHMHFPVSYAQFYLLDDNTERQMLPIPGAKGESSAGILRTVRGGAFFVTGLGYGVIDLTVGITSSQPTDHLDEYEDVVEASLQVDTGTVAIHGWGNLGVVHLPTLPNGPGNYRLRYHARGMDECRDANSDTPLDFFLLQIWPHPLTPPAIKKVTSESARYWLQD